MISGQECLDKIGFVPLCSRTEYSIGEIIEFSDMASGADVFQEDGRGVVVREVSLQEMEEHCKTLGIVMNSATRSLHIYAVVAE